MIDRTTKLRWRRRVRRRQRQVEDIGSQTEENLDRHFFRRLGRLYEVRRFILAWLMLLVALIGAVVVQTRALGDYYLKIVPVAGGIYSEGILGTYTNANPIFATGDVDTAVSRLLFSSLFSYDADNILVGDIAEGWSVDESGKIYTVKLRQDIFWHDETQLTAKDVLFTYQTIQNPDARSPLFSSWSGVKIEASDEHTLTFTLPNVLASFPYSMTNGIIPEHLLKEVAVTDLRGSLFNTIEPVGTGPFKWGGVEVVGDTVENREQRIALKANNKYHKGPPRVTEFILRAYLNENALVGSFDRGELNAVVGALSMPLSGNLAEEYNISLTGSVMIFFRNTQEVLQDAKVRRALTFATNQKEIIRSLAYSSKAVTGPLLPEHIGYDETLMQYGFDLEQAKKLLEEAGWMSDLSGDIRVKDGHKLSMTLTTLSSAEYAGVATQLQKQWRLAGVDLIVNSFSQDELQSLIGQRAYDALMYGIVMGVDADQFAYWHSTQADVLAQQRLNFSDYKSATADAALEAGRTRINAELRAAKYKPFLQSWRDDAPAIALYRPRFIYTTYDKVYNFQAKDIHSPTDRFLGIEQWMIRTDRAVN
ncbi:hypothetical protein H0V99_02185 [Candidatus Saccharibacteria bacterium]|nr:hypothetical protein [Candidatus Saccharibacteria bacterium]